MVRSPVMMKSLYRVLRSSFSISTSGVPAAIAFQPRFKPFVEDVLPGMLRDAPGIVAHPGAALPCPAGEGAPGLRTLILGPEGGFTDYEIGALITAGARPVHLGPRILRTEVALAALLGRLSGSVMSE